MLVMNIFVMHMDFLSKRTGNCRVHAKGSGVSARQSCYARICKIMSEEHGMLFQYKYSRDDICMHAKTKSHLYSRRFQLSLKDFIRMM